MRQSALDVFALLDHLNIERCKVIGMSGGGMTSLRMATQAPHRIQALVLISATTHFPEQARVLMRGTTEESQTEDSWAMMRGLRRHGDEQIWALWRVGRSFAESQNDMAFTAETLSSITAPTLIVHGDRGPLFPLDIAISMHDAIPKSWLWVVPNGGHLSLVAEGLSDPFVVTATSFLRGDWPSP
jgi:pimeloyl-ACP methyl ester carboxylesterase